MVVFFPPTAEDESSSIVNAEQSFIVFRMRMELAVCRFISHGRERDHVVTASNRAHVTGYDTPDHPSICMEGTMNGHDRTPSRQDRAPSRQESVRVTRNLHSMVYIALVGLVLWLVLATWGFGYDSQTDYLLAIVTGFLIIAVAIPATCALMAYSQGT